MPKQQNLLTLPPKIEQQLINTVREFDGQSNVLESALGALIVGQHFGWRVSKLIHHPSTYTKYEKVLGIKFQDYCPEETKFSTKSNAFKIAKKFSSFWAVVRGKIPVDDGKNVFTKLEEEK